MYWITDVLRMRDVQHNVNSMLNVVHNFMFKIEIYLKVCEYTFLEVFVFFVDCVCFNTINNRSYQREIINNITNNYKQNTNLSHLTPPPPPHTHKTNNNNKKAQKKRERKKTTKRVTKMMIEI